MPSLSEVAEIQASKLPSADTRPKLVHEILNALPQPTAPSRLAEFANLILIIQTLFPVQYSGRQCNILLGFVLKFQHK